MLGGMGEPTLVARPMIPLDNAEVAVHRGWVAGVYLGDQYTLANNTNSMHMYVTQWATTIYAGL